MLFTKKEVAERINSCKGIGQAVEKEIYAVSINDPVLAEAWKKAEEAIDEIYWILEPYLEF